MGRDGIVTPRTSAWPDVGWVMPGEQADERGLAGPVRAQQPVDAPGRQVEVTPSTAATVPNRLTSSRARITGPPAGGCRGSSVAAGSMTIDRPSDSRTVPLDRSSLGADGPLPDRNPNVPRSMPTAVRPGSYARWPSPSSPKGSTAMIHPSDPELRGPIAVRDGHGAPVTCAACGCRLTPRATPGSTSTRSPGAMPAAAGSGAPTPRTTPRVARSPSPSDRTRRPFAPLNQRARYSSTTIR